ncbi:reverse transcriptase [Gossypium australe]|uniref:Reverse transcriptase n=1 Tax=Gossypium australe TaxID=47621 RepID=A0A5B6X8U9_9ROSI|nr:reverse transcriptase [Gossypium australe]
MEGCLAVSAEGKSGGLALMWKEGNKVTIQNYSKYHIDSLVKMDDGKDIRFTGFYGQADPTLRNQAWDMLRRIKSNVREEWIVGGDFNAILNNAEKEGGRRKSQNLMNDFRSNNREGADFVKERLDRFIVSEEAIEKMPYIDTKVVCQSKSDHDAILLNTIGSKPKERKVDLKQSFRYDACWAKEQEAKDIINRVWSKINRNFMEKVEDIRENLGPWQYQRYKRMRSKINNLEKKIGIIMDNPSNTNSTRLLKLARGKLGHLYDVEEKYWMQRARIQWLKEGDRNTRYFHVRATSRQKKNSIERLKYSNGEWHEDKSEICNVAWNYFNNLFKSTIDPNEDVDLQFIPICITDSMNRDLDKEFTDAKILTAFNQMDPRKAPGIDGLPGSFFKDHWQTVGKDVLRFCHDILRETNNIHNINETLLIMIPKIENPCNMSNFRPISLCRVIYKIVSKVLGRIALKKRSLGA